MTAGIYRINNTISNKSYIGSSKDIANRWKQHTYYLRKGKHPNPHLQYAWDKYGEDAFSLEILEECAVERIILISREQHYIDTLLPEYNVCPTAGSTLGSRHTDETRKKMSEAHRGRAAHNKGVPMPVHVKRILVEANTNRDVSEITRQKLREAATGKKHSVETRKKISERIKERPPEFWKTLGEQRKGRVESEMTREKKRAAMIGKNKGKIHSLDARQNMSEAHKGQIAHNKMIFTDTDLKNVYALHDNGKSLRAIAEMYNCSRTVISRLLKERNND
jgi:group I intron endonuclease